MGMKYHVNQMETVNATIAELWQQVYRGADIETVLIRSDVSDDGAEKLNLRTNSTYTVMMRVNGEELEMRGRCSAGQKMLTCIVIRLAIASAFGCSCGIMTLDEPTTNLDAENSEALALAIARLIESRRDNRNFQMILITHDESFVNLLTRVNPCERIYRVNKGRDGRSKIDAEKFVGL